MNQKVKIFLCIRGWGVEVTSRLKAIRHKPWQPFYQPIKQSMNISSSMIPAPDTIPHSGAFEPVATTSSAQVDRALPVSDVAKEAELELLEHEKVEEVVNS
eukprot:Gregarina_sp_Poly_1__2486@NODE_1674_length_3553_cov_1178_510040_g1100_i0_p5_GENE_NODE_1674_length_3553_cov_1178_510040_g1100_i0NODE_1674_length_3553_cov_1178_510040_g1100_i0_p5_ORF_typecomplete_len101_score11_59_NODE_1674_length_3553_cov_1178_510040_g1100_i030943396